VAANLLMIGVVPLAEDHYPPLEHLILVSNFGKIADLIK
jgi:hypothetical protein